MPQLYLPREWLRKQQRIQRERFGEHKLTCTNRVLHLEILPFASHKFKPISLPSHPQIPDGGLPVNFQQIRSMSPSHMMPFREFLSYNCHRNTAKESVCQTRGGRFLLGESVGPGSGCSWPSAGEHRALGLPAPWSFTITAKDGRQSVIRSLLTPL